MWRTISFYVEELEGEIFKSVGFQRALFTSVCLFVKSIGFLEWNRRKSASKLKTSYLVHVWQCLHGMGIFCIEA